MAHGTRRVSRVYSVPTQIRRVQVRYSGPFYKSYTEYSCHTAMCAERLRRCSPLSTS